MGDAYFVANWRRGLQIVSCSEFCRGLVPPTNGRKQVWRADFDWFLKPDSLVKLLEGKYGGVEDDPGASPAQSASRSIAVERLPVPPLTVEEVTNAAAFNAWLDRQETFSRDDQTRHNLHSVRYSVVRLFRDPSVARDQLFARLRNRANGCEIEVPSYEDRQQAAQDLEEISRQVDVGSVS